MDTLRQLIRAELLIIDELGMKKMPPNAADDLLEVIHRRYQHSATIIATNRIVSDWGAILGDSAATAAILERLPRKRHRLHHQGQILPPDQDPRKGGRVTGAGRMNRGAYPAARKYGSDRREGAHRSKI